MLTIEAKVIHKEANGIAEYLSDKAETTVRTKGGMILLESANTKQVKLLLHKYLHQRHLDEYRVQVVHPGLIKIMPPQSKDHRESQGKQGSPPPPSATLPWSFPNGSLPLPVRKSKTSE